MPNWPHAPPHHIGPDGVYMVTAGTYGKLHHFHTEDRLDFLQDLLFQIAEEFGWRLEAWALLSNHYHFIASPGGDSRSLPELIRKLHSLSARHINQLEASPGRKIWHNYRDSHVVTERSYLARLHYVHANAVHHKLVAAADRYRWCSAAWFESHSDPARVQTVYGFPIDRLLASDADWT